MEGGAAGPSRSVLSKLLKLGGCMGELPQAAAAHPADGSSAADGSCTSRAVADGRGQAASKSTQQAVVADGS
jgi:hypothetical protein